MYAYMRAQMYMVVASSYEYVSVYIACVYVFVYVRIVCIFDYRYVTGIYQESVRHIYVSIH